MIPPQRLFTILLNTNPAKDLSARIAFSKLEGMLGDCMVARLASSEAQVLTAMVAVVRWCVLRQLGSTSHVKLKQDDIVALLELKINLTNIEKMVREVPGLIHQLLALDGPRDFAYRQKEIRQFLLDADSALVANIFESQAEVGAVCLEFLLNHFGQGCSESKHCALLSHPFAKYWRGMLRGKDDDVVPDPLPLNLECSVNRMTPGALCYAMQSSQDKDRLQKVVELASCRARKEDCPVAFFKRILVDLGLRQFRLQLQAVDFLYAEQPEHVGAAASELASDAGGITQAVLLAHVLAERDVTLWLPHLKQFGSLPIRESAGLVKVLINVYGGLWSNDPTKRVQCLTELVSKDGFKHLFC